MIQRHRAAAKETVMGNLHSGLLPSGTLIWQECGLAEDTKETKM